MTETTIHDLPFELVLLTLLQVATPRDLYSLIQVSKQFNLVFEASKRCVLSALVSRLIPQEVTADAYAACKAPKIATQTDLIPADFSTRIRMEIGLELKLQIRDFVAEYRHWQLDGCVPRLDLVTLVGMCRLWSLTDPMILDYSNKALGILERDLKDRTPIPPKEEAFQPELSMLEYTRFQRAFFRFEVMRKLYGARAGWFMNMDDIDEDEATICSSPWEHEEVHWIHAYLSAQIADYMEQAEVDIVEDAEHRAQLSAAVGFGRLIDHDEKNEAWNIRADTPYLELLTCIGRLRGRMSQANFLVGLGLPFMRTLSAAESKRRVQLLSHHSNYKSKTALTEVLDISLSLHDIRAGLNRPNDIASPDSLRLPNPGWLWKLRHGEFCGGLFFDNFGMASTALIFWDRIRLQKMNLFRRSTAVLSILSGRLKWRSSQTLEQRILDISISPILWEGLIPAVLSDSEMNGILEAEEY